MYSFFTSPPEGYEIVPVRANLGAMFGLGGISVPPQNTPPFPFQQLDFHEPLQHYNSNVTHMPSPIHATPTTHYPYMHSLSSSREATPSSTMSAEIHNPLHESGEGPIRSIRVKRRNYTPKPKRPRSASDSRRLASLIDNCTKYVTAPCKIDSCGRIFTDPNEYETHVNEDHKIPKGKNGDKAFLCPWDGCGKTCRQSSIWNHLMIHNMTTQCCLCLTITPGTRHDTLKKHLAKCSGIDKPVPLI